jgi:hypothetical protein
MCCGRPSTIFSTIRCADHDDYRFLHLRAEAQGRGDAARQHMGKFVESNFDHCEFLGEHFATVKGYDAYVQKAEIARKDGLEGAVEGFMKAVGHPGSHPPGIGRRGVIGDFELNASFRFGGMPYEKAEASLRLFAKEVLPVLKSWHSQAAKAAE